MCRTPDGRWWSKLDIDNAVRVVREAGRVVRIELEEGVRELQDRQRRLELTPADEVADEKAMADPELVRALREVTRRG